jgi:AraC-like DNA-binding protein
MLYREYPPCPALAPYLACLWICHLPPGSGPVSHRVLPDNCIDILWQDSRSAGSVAGMMSTAIDVAITQPVRTFAVRFKAGAAALFFDLPLNHLIDLHPSLDALWERGAAARFADAIWTRPLSDTATLAAIEGLLLERLQHGHRPGLVEHALASIEAAHGALRVDALADSLGVSRQHLASQFKARVGLGTKLYARVCRFQHARSRIAATPLPRLELASLALELGYHDQPHMTHEFAALAGATPQSFAR